MNNMKKTRERIPCLFICKNARSRLHSIQHAHVTGRITSVKSTSANAYLFILLNRFVLGDSIKRVVLKM